VVKRRSLDDALTPEEKAFVKSGTSKPKPKTNPKPEPDKKEETPMPRPIALKEYFPHEAAPPVQPQKFASAGQSQAGIASINARIDPAITGALIRASVEQRLAGKRPSTQREIIAEALTDWFKKSGFWK
jgi:hypothetical protein